MPFGILDARNTSQRMANLVFKDLIGKKSDGRIPRRYFSTHENMARTPRSASKSVLHTKVQPTTSTKKCKWSTLKLKFFGFVISAEGIRIDSEKVLTITQFSQPETVKKVHSFLGLVTFSLKFVPHLASIAHPLRALLKKGVKF